jgi:hypothetical protein
MKCSVDRDNNYCHCGILRKCRLRNYAMSHQAECDAIVVVYRLLCGFLDFVQAYDKWGFRGYYFHSIYNHILLDDDRW